MATIGNLVVNVTAKTGGLQRGLGKAKSLISGTSGKMSGLASLAGGALVTGATAGAVAVGALATGMVGVGAAGVEAAASLDQQMSNIAAVMGQTKDQVQPLKDLIFDLSLDPNLTVDATQAADAIEMLARNGLSMAEILGGAAESTVALANATGADFGTAGNVATDVMALFNIEAQNMKLAVDGITGVTTNSKFAINDYALALANSGSLAAGMGVSLADLNTVIAGTAASFNSGQESGTAFKTFLQRMAAPTNEMKTLMAELGISLFDQNGQMRDMSVVVQQLHTAFAGMTEAQRAQTATALGGADASRIVLALAKMTSSEFNTLSQNVNASGQAAESAATRVDSLKGAWQIFMGIVDSIKIQIGDALMPAVRTAVESFSQFATKVGPIIVDVFGGAGALLSDKIIPAIMDMVDDALPMLKQIWEALAESWRSQIQPALENLFAGLGQLFNAFGGTNTQSLSFQASMATLQGLLQAVAFVINSVAMTLKALATILRALMAPVNTAKAVWDGFIATITNAWNTVQQFAMTIANAIPNAINRARQFIENLIRDLARIVVPPFLRPGSPTPFELGLRGIGRAIRDMPELEIKAKVPDLAGVGAGGNVDNRQFDNRQFNLINNLGQNGQRSTPRDLATISAFS